MAPSARDRHISLEDLVPADLPSVIADRQRVVQILINLLSNAIKFTSAGGRVQVDAKPGKGDCLRVAVSDTGKGIAPEDLPRLFQRFSQVGGIDGTVAGGAGLGLFITRQLVEAHGGTIHVESKPGAGSTFWFTLPALVPESHRNASRTRNRGPGEQPICGKAEVP